MKLLIVTQYFPPESGAPQNRWVALAENVSQLGHEVRVLTAMPNYPVGQVFDGYRGKLFCREKIGSIAVYRTWLYTTPSKKLWRRMMTYVSFGITALVLGFLFIRGVDLLIWESPPLFLGPFAKALAVAKRARCVMNVSDLWPESAVALGLVGSNSLATRMAERLELWLYRHSDAVTGQTEGIVAAIVERVPDVPVKLFPNGVDVMMFSPTPPDPQLVQRFELEGKFVIGYGGIIGYAQALGQVLDAALLLSDQTDIVFALFGDGPVRPELIERAKQLGLKNLRFLPRQNRSDMPKIISLWDVGLVPLADHPLFAGARPSKMFELMGMAKPIIFCGKGEGAAIIENSGCGLVVPPEQPRRLADAIRRLRTGPEELNQMSQKARKLAVEEFDRSQIATRVSQFLQSLI